MNFVKNFRFHFILLAKQCGLTSKTSQNLHIIFILVTEA